MRQMDFNATKFVHAIKGERMNGYGHVPVRGVSMRLDNQNASQAARWFGLWAAGQLAGLVPMPTRIALIPIPNSGAVTGGPGDFKTKLLADEILPHLGARASVAPVLTWREPMRRSHDGGTRDPCELFENLHCAGYVPEAVHIVVDDVKTTGGHIQACAAKLGAVGAPVVIAVCAAKTEYTQLPNTFVVPMHQIDDFQPV